MVVRQGLSFKLLPFVLQANREEGTTFSPNKDRVSGKGMYFQDSTQIIQTTENKQVADSLPFSVK